MLLLNSLPICSALLLFTQRNSCCFGAVVQTELFGLQGQITSFKFNQKKKKPVFFIHQVSPWGVHPSPRVYVHLQGHRESFALKNVTFLDVLS